MISLSLVRLCNLKIGVGHHASVQAGKDLFEFQSWRDFFFFFLNWAVLFGRPSLRYYKEIPLEIKQVSVTVSTSFIGCRIFYNNEATECGKDWCGLINIPPHTWGAGGLVFICPWHIDGSESSRKTQLLSYLLPSLTLLFTNELYTFISRQRTDRNKILINYQYGAILVYAWFYPRRGWSGL